MKMQKKSIFMPIALGIFIITCLPSCMNWFSKKEESTLSKQNVAQESLDDNQNFLLKIDGKTVLTVDDYEDQLEAARQANPQIDMILQMIPDAEEKFIYKSLEATKLTERWCKDQGLDKNPEFQKERKQLHDAVDAQLCMKYFDNAHPIHISDSDLKKYYEEKKDSIPGLSITQGGVQIHYVRFDSKDKAEEFKKDAHELKTVDAFKSLAEKQNLAIADATINQKSNFGDIVKNAVLAISKFPNVDLIKVSDEPYWVVFATGKVESKYRDLKDPAVHEGLKKMITDERKAEQYEGLMNDLHKQFNVEVNRSYFVNKEQKKRKDLEAMHGHNMLDEDQHDEEDHDHEKKQ